MSDEDEITPPRLYHYTTTAGLMAICDSSALWATDAEFLNDAQEVRFGRRELCESLRIEGRRLAGDHRGGGAESSRGVVMLSAAETLEPSGTSNLGGPADENLGPYVTCFCEDADLLSQWRGYAAGGVAIGFRTAGLEPAVPSTLGPDPKPGRQLVKVRYGDRAIASMVQRVIQDIAPHPTGHPNSSGWGRAHIIAKPGLASVKHAAFKEEHEWRLIAMAVNDAETGFRPGPFGLTPYLSLSIDRSIIEEVLIGPGPHRELRELSVRRFLKKWNIQAEVNHSQAPFRG